VTGPVKAEVKHLAFMSQGLATSHQLVWAYNRGGPEGKVFRQSIAAQTIMNLDPFDLNFSKYGILLGMLIVSRLIFCLKQDAE
jgi:hypothetical protein